MAPVNPLSVSEWSVIGCELGKWLRKWLDGWSLTF